MKELWEILKQAGFTTATLAQALVAAGGFTLIAMLATGLSMASALPMLIGAFVLALLLIAGLKGVLAWRDRPRDAKKEKSE
jgi:uncharacterized membrane protein